uniref:Alpha 2 protein n=1 Tax=Bovine ephemeral fever virus TaxID=11303 RepID=A0A5B9BKV9_BEFV|nr:alpha 2 protein [Bovine ephemeral fever virus]QED88220.1 alpha 2 protein [Bovine ephemeral fever virus]QED88231.1 alpha 2 protein [Bovine ephemeral fever virus]QED88242.1 alpha 2 protein [Bovine ephemeral fever virus]
MFGYMEINVNIETGKQKGRIHKLELWKLMENGLHELMKKERLGVMLKEEANFGFCRWLNTRGNWLSSDDIKKPILIEFHNFFNCLDYPSKVYKITVENNDYKLGSIKNLQIKLFFF